MADLHRGGARGAKERARAEAQLSGGGGFHHRRDPGRRARRTQRFRADELGRDPPEARGSDGRRVGDDSRHSGRSDVSGRYQIDHRAQPYSMIPGEIKVASGDIELNKGRRTVVLKVVNTGDRPIQVGSHYHFFETNDALRFERKAAYGFRLNIAAGTAVRFEPGHERTLELVALGRRPQGYRLTRYTTR